MREQILSADGEHQMLPASPVRRASHPERTALVWGDRRFSYGELDARVNRLPRVLSAHGVGGRMPRPATVLGNRPEWIEGRA